MKKIIVAFILFCTTTFSMESPCSQKEIAELKSNDHEVFLKRVQSRIAKKKSLNKPLHGDASKRPPLLRSVSNDRYIPITQLLLENGADPNKPDDTYGNNPLYTAAFYFNDKAIQLLCEKGANPNKFFDDKSPLWQICAMDSNDKNKSEKRIAITTALLKSRANPNIKFWGNTCLHELIGTPYQCFFEIYPFEKYPNEIRSLFLSNRKELIKLFLDHGGDLSITNRKGKSPIDLALNNEYHPENKKDCKELADFAINYLNDSRKKLVTRILLRPFGSPKFSPFMKMPKKLVKMIVFRVYPSHKKKG